METDKILQRISSFISTRGVNLHDELSSFDFKKCGSVSEISFPRCINHIGIQLSPSQFNALIKRFSHNEMINIDEFIQAVQNSNEVIKEETLKPKNCTEELMWLKDLLIKRRQQLYDIFRSYDRFNNGCVPSSTFYTEFGFSQSVKNIIQNYEIDGSINYNQVQKDLNLINSNPVEPNLPKIFDVLANFISSKGIDVRQYLARFIRSPDDPQCILSTQAFVSFISSMGVNLRPSEMEELINPFKITNDSYDASKFCYLIEKQAFEIALQSSQKSKTINIPQQILQSIDPNQSLANLKDYFKSHRVNVRELFEPLNQEGLNGIVEESRFIRLFNQFRFAINKIELIQAASLFPGDRLETINYHQFLDAITDKPALPGPSIDEILTNLRNFLKNNKKYIRSIAAKYDREKSGDITMNQFVSVLQLCQIRLSNQEVKMIQSIFPGRIPATIDWISLCEEVDPQEPHFLQSRILEKTTQLETRMNVPLVRQLPQNIEKALKQIKIAISKANYDLNQMLIRLDEDKQGAIHQNKFLNILSNPPLSIDASTLRVLIAFYRLSGSIEIDYITLCRDLSEINPFQDNGMNDSTKANTNDNNFDTIEIPSNIPMIVHSLLQRYKLFISENPQFNLMSPFTPLDGAKSGFINAQHVRECFISIGFETSRDEVEAAISTFIDSRRINAFNYYMFVKAVHAEQTMISTGITPEIRQEVAETQVIIKDRLSSRNRRIWMGFSGIVQQTIPIETFFERLASMELYLRSSQANALVKFYKTNQTDQIDWKRFCNDVENCKTVQL